MLASFDVHTDATIEQGRAVARKLLKLLNVSPNIFYVRRMWLLLMHSNCQEFDEGGWRYPKVHLIQHLFDDIEAKGVTRNYTSKTFEKMHGPLGETYERKSNFKDVSEQVGNYHLIYPYWHY